MRMKVESTGEAQLVAHRYAVTDTLYEGRSAQVLRVEDRVLPASGPLVLKWVPGRSGGGERALRLENEYRLLEELRHPGFARPHDFGYDIPRDRTFLVMEEVPGTPLDHLSGAPSRLLEVVAAELLRGLHQLHRRSILHLDVKPRNVLVDAGTGRTTLLDLDLAAYPESAAGRGTAPYASPEVTGPGETPDPRADLYSLGVTLFEGLVGCAPGEVPAGGLDPGEQAGARLRGLIQALTVRDPRRRPTGALEALRLLEASRGSLPEPEPRTTLLRLPFVGRRREQERLLEAVPADLAVRPSAPVAVIRAGPGTGKTRLLQELEVEWRTAGLRVINVPAGPGTTPTLAAMLSLEELLRRWECADPDPALTLEGLARRERLGGFDRLAGRILSLAGSRRTVLCLEDVDRYDSTSRDFLLHLLRRVVYEASERETGSRVAVVLTCRPESLRDDRLKGVLDLEGGAGNFCVVDLEPLDARKTGEMLRPLLPPGAPLAELAEAVHRRTGGLPLLVRELLLAVPGLGDGGPDPVALLEEAQSPRSLPQSLQGIISARLQRRTQEDRSLLEALAVFPLGAGADVLTRMTGGQDLERRLTALKDAGLLDSHEERWHFREGVTRDAVLAGLSTEQRAVLHDAAADALPPGGAPDHEAYHRLRGTRPRKGLVDIQQVVRRLLDRGSLEEAALLLQEVRHLRRISPFAARWASLLLADLHVRRGQHRKARNLLEHYAKRDHPPDVSARLRLARVHRAEGHLPAARSIYEALLGLGRELGSRDQVATRVEYAEMLLAGGHVKHAGRVLEEAAGGLRPVFNVDTFYEDPGPLDRVRAPRFPWPGEAAPLLAAFLSTLGDLFRRNRKLGSGLRCHFASVKLRSRLGDLSGLASALHSVGSLFVAGGQLELAERYFTRALNLRREVGDLAGIGATANNLGVLMRRLGRTAEAIEHFRTSLRIARQIGHAAGETYACINIANVYYMRRELEPAERYYRLALETARRMGDARSQAQIANNLGAVAHLEDRHEQALEHYREAETLDRMVGNVPGALLRRVNRAEECLRVGLPERARRLLRVVERVARHREAPGLPQRLNLVAARCLRLLGDLDGARRRVARARSLLDPQDEDSLAEVVLEEVEIHLEAGEPERALALLDETGGGVSREAEAQLVVVRARACLAAGRADLAGVLARVEAGERFAQRAGLRGLVLELATARGLLQERLENPGQVLSACAVAFEALEEVVASVQDPDLLEVLLGTPRVRRFVDLAERLRGLGAAGAPRTLLPAAESVFNRLREILFEAERRLGPEGPRREEADLRRVLDVTRTLSSTAPINELLRDVVDEAVAFSRAERGFLLTVDTRGRNRVSMARDRNREPIPDPEKQISRRIVEQVLRNGESLRLNDARDESSFSSTESVVNLELRSVLCSPLVRAGRVVGLLYVDNRARQGQFGAEDLELLDVFAAQAAVALENARLWREFARDEKIRVMGTLASGVAHDFNNLLTTILGRAQEVKRLAGTPEMRAALRTIETAARDGAVVVRRMQELTRRRREGEFRAVRVKELVDDVVDFTRYRWEQDTLRRGHRIHVEVEVGPNVLVVGNPAELREVLTNLVLNAVAAMPEGGRLRLAAEKAAGRATILVEDTGVGMSEEVREGIFDPYFTTRGTDGSGLGLSIAYGIILRHNGTIEVDSEPGAGTRVRVELPLAEEEPREAERVAARPGGRVSLAGWHALVVDDEEGVRLLLRDVLVRAGLTVDLAPDGARALELFQERPADVVVTDLGMVPLDGWELSRQVKARRPETLVVLVTGWGGEIDQEAALRRNVDLLLSKPFDVEETVGRIAEAAALLGAARAPGETGGESGEQLGGA